MADRIAKGLSDQDVVRFLRQMVTLYKDRRSGNPALAEALRKLADRLEKEAAAQRVDSSPAQSSLWVTPSTEELRAYDDDAISTYINDEARTKLDLVELAFARFSIPRSKLQRMPAAEIRDAISAALKHEQSLKIISEEAERYGASRRS
ncbi:hypothetical protein NKI88_09700 [Mesorhizobium sp. M0317]|uniref:hypothetical protein n=1 Tax=Mesorhizobium sp. M0317 TaxID=2956935 RepID=UPI00333B3DD8